jgi:hypothetical protein
MSRASEPLIDTTDDMVAAVQESAHTAYFHFTRRGVFSAEIDRNGGGRFRPTDGPDLDRMLTGREPPITVSTSAQSKREWVELLIGMAVPKFAQQRFCGSDLYDGKCEHDDLVVNRVLSSIASSRDEQREMQADIEHRARQFVHQRWPAIMRLARVLFARGRLNESEIRSVLSRAPSVKLNAAGADLAFDLVSAGKLNWGGFAWDSPDDDDLLDEPDGGSKYHLGVDDDVETVGAGKFVYPFAKPGGGEVYVQALQDAAA